LKETPAVSTHRTLVLILAIADREEAFENELFANPSRND